jgi:hypothetical protein
MINPFIKRLREEDIVLVIDTKYNFDLITAHLTNHRVTVDIDWADACYNENDNFAVIDNSFSLVDDSFEPSQTVEAEEFFTLLNASYA